MKINVIWEIVYLKMAYVKLSNIVFVLPLLLILISGCSNNGAQKDLGNMKLGLEIKPFNEEINEDMPFNVILTVRNYGDYPTYISSCLTDFREGGIPDNTCIENQKIDEATEVKNRVRPGEKSIIFGKGNEFVYTGINRETTTTIAAFSRFNYMGEATKEVCIKGSNTLNDKCEDVNNNFKSIKKGPIMIENIKFEESNLEDDVYLNVYIDLVEISDGRVLGEGVKFDVDLKLTDTIFECTGEKVRDNIVIWSKEDSKKLIKCSNTQPIKTKINNLYKDIFIIDLEYEYEVGISKEVRINDRDQVV